MAKQVSAATPNQVNIIAKGTVFEGTLKADSDVSVSGRIIGKLEVTGRAVVAPDGTVEGEIKASNANISGTVLDFSDGLNGKGFVFNNPKAARTCGCGSSFNA